jgi:Uma2 family endonuclease
MSVAQGSSRLAPEQYETLGHRRLQFRLANLLNARFTSGECLPEVPYVPRREPLELRAAHVAWLDRRPRDDQYLEGAPSLVIEILSHSNTAREINRKEQLSFAAGTRQFWLIDTEDRTIRVTSSDGSFHVYTDGDYIPLDPLEPGVDALPVSLVFTE